MDWVTMTFFLLSVALLFIGVIGFIRTFEWWLLWIGVAFAIMAVTFMMEFLGLNTSSTLAVNVMRIASYVIIGVTLGWTGFRR